MSSNFDFNKEWGLSIERHLSRLGKKRKHIPILSYDKFQSSVIQASKDHSRQPTTMLLEKLDPVFDQLNTFLHAITSIVQSSPDLIGFIWGATQALVTVASRFITLLSTIRDMLYELASIIIQLNRYLALFPKSTELQECTRKLLDDYVGFLISSFLFFKRLPLYNLLRLFWSNIDKKFANARENIAKHYTEFDRRRQYHVDSTLIDYSTRMLQALPAVTILPAAPLGLFEVPLVRNPHFSERQNEVLCVREYLSLYQPMNSGRYSSCLLHGLGGVGKTSIALEYAYSYRDEYDFVFWIPSETELVLTNAAANVSRKLKLGSQENIEEEPKLQVERFRLWLETQDNNKWLLILDNVEEEGLVLSIWPRTTNGHVLLTSQKSELAHLCSSTISVPPLDKLSGARFLLKQRAICQSNLAPPPQQGWDSVLVKQEEQHGFEEQRRAELIATELSGNPLAILFIAGTFSSLNLDEILLELQQQTSFAEITADNLSRVLVHYDRPFGRTWDVSRENLPPKSLLLVQSLAMLSPVGLAEDVIFAGQGVKGLSRFGFVSKSQYHSLVSNMSSRCLIERQSYNGQPYLLMHRVVQKHVLSQLEGNPADFQAIFELSFRMILDVFPKQSPVQTPQNELWKERELISPHVLSLCLIYNSHRASLPSIGFEFAELLTDASSYFWERGLYKEADQTSIAAEAICDCLENSLSPEVANVYAISAAIQADHGISQRAKSWERRVKALYIKQCHLHSLQPVAATDEVITIWGNAWNDIGCSLNDFGFYAESLDFISLAWEQRQTSPLCQEDYNHFPESPMNKALALAGIGKYEEAIALISKTAENTKESFGRDSALSQQVQFCLASILVSAGSYSEALYTSREVYQTRTKLFGLSSRPTSDAAYLLATVEQKRGNMDRAALILETTLARSNGWTIEGETRAKYRLGKILMCYPERKDDAIPLIKEAENKLKELWSLHGNEVVRLSHLDKEGAFDLLVPILAGRSTVGRQTVRGNSGLGPLADLCKIVLKRIRGGVNSSPSRLCELLNVTGERSWPLWLNHIQHIA